MVDSYYSYESYKEGLRLAGGINTLIENNKLTNNNTILNNKATSNIGLNSSGPWNISIKHTFSKDTDSSINTFFEQRNKSIQSFDKRQGTIKIKSTSKWSD